MNYIFLVMMALLVVGFGNTALAQSSDRLAVLETDLGTIVLEFFPSDAPNHVDNFIGLAESNFYDGVLFHRIIPGFMIQGGDPNTISGDPNTWGTGGPDTSVVAEFNSIKHNRGLVSMARSTDPNSGGSQFFIVHKDSNFLDGQYTVFGRIVTDESFQTLDKIAEVETAAGDVPLDTEQVRIISVTIVDRSEVSDLLELSDPERSQSTITTPASPPITSRDYESEKLGVGFSAPEGWVLQELDKVTPDSPDVVAIGPKTGTTTPYISLTVQNSTQTLDELIIERNEKLTEIIESGSLNIISQDKTTINGDEAYVTVAEGIISPTAEDFDVQFKEVIISNADKFYILAYANGLDDYTAQLPNFDETIDSFDILASEMSGDADSMMSSDTDTMMSTDDTSSDSTSEKDSGSGGCLIATATFGSELAPQVQQLRELRDNVVLSTTSGTTFMTGFNQLYYSFSPIIADYEREHPVFKEAVKLAITPMLSTLSILNHVDIDSEYEMITFGLGILLLNIGMYIAAPATIIYKIRK